MTQGNNIACVIGRVGNDPEVKPVGPDNTVAKFNVAVNRTVKDKQGNYVTDWFPCEFWRKQAELAGEYIKKGTLVSVVGAFRIEKWEDKNGNKRERFYIAGDTFQLLSPKGENTGGSGGGSTSKAADDDWDDVGEDIPPF